MIELRKIAINTITGRFKLSNDAIVRLSRRGHIMATESLGGKRDAFDDSKLLRHDPILIDVIQELKMKASADGSSIWLVETTASHYKIKTFDGIERIKDVKDPAGDPKVISIVSGDHLAQYDFEGLEERLAKEESDRAATIASIVAKAAERLAKEAEAKKKPAKKTSKKQSAGKSA